MADPTIESRRERIQTFDFRAIHPNARFGTASDRYASWEPRLKEMVPSLGIQLSDEQIRLLERFSPEFRERHIVTKHTGDLVAVDTFFVGTLKGVHGDGPASVAVELEGREVRARAAPPARRGPATRGGGGTVGQIFPARHHQTVGDDSRGPKW